MINNIPDEVIVQVNGKFRGRLYAPPQSDGDMIVEEALKLPNIVASIGDASIARVINNSNLCVNIVTDPYMG